MSTLDVEQARATALSFTDDLLVCELADGRTITVPLAYYPRLLHATPEQRNDFRWIGRGSGIHWPQIDEDLSVRGFLFGWKAPGSA